MNSYNFIIKIPFIKKKKNHFVKDLDGIRVHQVQKVLSVAAREAHPSQGVVLHACEAGYSHRGVHRFR